MERLCLGILAREFPPTVGGMQEYARGFANALAGADTVTVYMPARRSVAEAPYRQRPILRGAIAADLGVLAREEVDAWYALNAGFVPLAPHLAAKFFATFHGNDFLNPWLGYENAWLTRTLKVPGAWRWAAWLLRTLRQRAIRQGLEATAHVFAVSRSTADLIARVFPQQMAPVSVVPPGVDDTFFQEGDAQSVLPLRLLTVARLTCCPEKAVLAGLVWVRTLVRWSPGAGRAGCRAPPAGVSTEPGGESLGPPPSGGAGPPLNARGRGGGAGAFVRAAAGWCRARPACCAGGAA